MNSLFKVVQPSGILSGVQANQLRQEINNLLDAGVNHILVDFKDVTFMDSSGLGVLVATLKRVKATDGRFSLCSVSPEIRILLEIADVERFFEIFAIRDEVIEPLSDSVTPAIG
jgi:anti-anti-sigma factor